MIDTTMNYLASARIGTYY